MGTLDICEYGVVCYVKPSKIEKLDPYITLRNLSTNLRHEINPILSLILQETNKLDPNLSTAMIDLEKPSNRIVGAVLIIDMMIQMISGVNDFQPGEVKHTSTSKYPLTPILRKYFSIHAILKNAYRAENLELRIESDRNFLIQKGGDNIEYIFNILFDNIWKYSISNTEVLVTIIHKEKNIFDISVKNESKQISDGLEIFSLGIKGDNTSKGFGFGLSWARTLINHYNNMLYENIPDLDLTHKQIKNEDKYYQIFTIHNVVLGD
ncbi:histidine kinase [Leptospira soteropolitanensis]|nr:hypothetical protein [Leptospira soteropolitanensis]MCW7502319.1 hypothetical protein [Leptospira soteropolitanensis]MCW7532277.1 hypothetical protein [Leptospira soteropolitanensis]